MPIRKRQSEPSTYIPTAEQLLRQARRNPAKNTSMISEERQIELSILALQDAQITRQLEGKAVDENLVSVFANKIPPPCTAEEETFRAAKGMETSKPWPSETPVEWIPETPQSPSPVD